MQQTLVEGEDYYYNEDGFIVLTARYHLRRGQCCGNGCTHCPYNYNNVPEEKRNSLPNPSLRGALEPKN